MFRNRALPLNTQPFEYEPLSWPFASIVTVSVTSSPNIELVAARVHAGELSRVRRRGRSPRNGFSVKL